jgi:hypothetical protein
MEIYAQFNQCRFGFRQALEAWPENERASAGLRRSIETMISYELAHGAPRAAQTLLAELQAPAPLLVDRVSSALTAAASKHARLEKLEEEADPTIGDLGKSLWGSTFVVLWIAATFSVGYCWRHGMLNITHNIVAAIILGGTGLVSFATASYRAPRIGILSPFSQHSRSPLPFSGSFRPPPAWMCGRPMW